MATTSRTSELNNDEALMTFCLSLAQLSKDPNIQVGACVVNSQGTAVSFGFNCTVNSCPDDWKKISSNEYPYGEYVCRADRNAILNAKAANVSLENGTLYTTLFPCNESAKFIIQHGLKRVVYLCDNYKNLEEFKFAREMFKIAEIPCDELLLNNKVVRFNFENRVSTCMEVEKNSEEENETKKRKM
ncbi:deoxycytidylate deaminase-like [Tribolium madens]|uniref:deoxycytidylate deaminase-like n=1 Tax=Tribolium madens TaxID=41895 RepID=UPI001CF72D67|nr:deoxycytidylate deaminase-like [Tribolium madens]